MIRNNSLCIVITAFWLTACQSSPLDRNQVTLYSDATMVRQGEAAYRQILRNERLSRDTLKNDMALCVTTRIVQALSAEERGTLRWEVNVFENDTANAFALPGGKIGVYSGLFRFARNEHQLAAVVAHEVSHVLSNHSNESASRDTLRSAGTVLAQIAGLPSGAVRALDYAAELGLFLPFNRAQESEADVMGLMLMARAGFDPGESVNLWRNMNEGRETAPPEFVSTHPSPATRIADLEALMGPARVLYEVAFANDKVSTCTSDAFLL
jgi:predicted Zn-dependent protease